jgi:hypothetical protein
MSLLIPEEYNKITETFQAGIHTKMISIIHAFVSHYQRFHFYIFAAQADRGNQSFQDSKQTL